MESKNSKSPDSRSPEQLRQPKEEPCELPESSIPTDYETFKQQQWEQEKQKRTNMCLEQWSNYQSFPTQRWEGERVEPQLVPQPTTQPTCFLDPNFGNPLTGLRGCLTSVYQPLLASESPLACHESWLQYPSQFHTHIMSEAVYSARWMNPGANEFDPRYPFGQYLYCPPSRSDAETSTVSVTGESSNQYLCFYENPTDEEFEKLKVFNSPLFGINNDKFPDRTNTWKRRRMFNQFMEKLYKKNAETIDVVYKNCLKKHPTLDFFKNEIQVKKRILSQIFEIGIKFHESRQTRILTTTSDEKDQTKSPRVN